MVFSSATYAIFCYNMTKCKEKGKCSLKIINNMNDILADNLRQDIQAGSKVSIAAAVFSVYAFEEMKAELSRLAEFRFIFTSPTFYQIHPKKSVENFIFPDVIERVPFAAVNLKYGFATNSIKKILQESVLTGSEKKQNLSPILPMNLCRASSPYHRIQIRYMHRSTVSPGQILAVNVEI